MVDLERARARLEQERARVESLVRELRASVTDRETEPDAQPTTFDPADTASDTAQRTEDLAILESLEAELAEIDAALARVADGSYGTDELTGEPVAPSTVATQLDLLMHKGYVTQTGRPGRSVYVPTCTREEATKDLLDDFLARVGLGRAPAFLIQGR